MRFENLEQASVIYKCLVDYRETCLFLSSSAVMKTVSFTVNQRKISVDRDKFTKFLQGEIQALNLELHNLGVELPGVATIGGAQSVTKGQDQ